ncbi:MAG: hypothetical protein IKM43_00115 [Clostridia bacterium]|nr:hypothetical protein [Clostridia bacterium]
MKGKIISFKKVLFLVLAVILSSACVISFSDFKSKSYADNKTPATTTTGLGGQNFSAVDQNNIIFSVEKVAVKTSDNENSQELGTEGAVNKLYNQHFTTTFDGALSMFSNKDTEYYYKNLQDENGNSKSVVYNNKYVMLENVSYSGAGGKTFYKMEEQPDLQQAIMVSLGQYIWDGSEVKLSTSAEGDLATKGAELSYINITAKRNGYDVTHMLPGVRQFNNLQSNDFAMIIPQYPENEGLWNFVVDYRYNDITYTRTFNFYLLFETSYTQIDGEYNARPTFNNVANIEGLKTFKLGTNLQYPTLTYDYTRYKMSYTHVSQGRTTKKHFNVKYSYVGDTEKADIVDENNNVVLSCTNYNNQSTNNFITFVFTEMGEYTFEFDYLCKGSALPMNLKIDDEHMDIYGFQSVYEKIGFDEAQMRKLTVAKNNKSELIMPNATLIGYEATAGDNLGPVYETQESSQKVGTILSCLDANVINPTNFEDFVQEIAVDSQYSALTDVTKRDNINTFLTGSNLRYPKTNQSSVKLTANEVYVSGQSFYFFNKTKFESYEDLFIFDKTLNKYVSKAQLYKNDTTFNQQGYYLVFMAVDVNKNGSYEIGLGDYYQVFAYQYKDDTINISVKETVEGGKIVGDNDYTNKTVQVSWDPLPGVFEKKLTANYYYGKSKVRENLIAHGTKVLNQLESGMTIGSESEVANGDWATYCIELIAEDGSATYRMFTIDRQPITNVISYAVNKYIYNLNTTVYTRGMALSNAIHNDIVTVAWDDKASGAPFSKVTYNYTPFVPYTVTNNLPKNSGEEVWVSTRYKLGSTSGEIEYIMLPQNAILGEKNTIYDPGIYVFTIVDDAGNMCKYMFVIDNTEAYFGLKENGASDYIYITRTSNLYSLDVEYLVGTHKVIELRDTETLVGASQDILKFLNIAANNTLVTPLSTSKAAYANAGYYTGSNSNYYNLDKLFNITQGKVYLTVKNNLVASYSLQAEEDNLTNIRNVSSAQYKNTISLSKAKENERKAGYVVRTLYLVGENQSLNANNATQSSSYVMIEINTDNSQGRLYYRNDALTLDTIGVFDANVQQQKEARLYHGSDMSMVNATKDNYVIFSWLPGAETNYEVESVTYTHYRLGNWNTDDSDLYFYNAYTNNTTTLYSSVSGYQNGATLYDDRIVYAPINVSAGQTAEGLYVVTRTYVSEALLGNDVKTLNYWFVVDRNGIIDGDVGSEIYINLLEQETSYNKISYSLTPYEFTYGKNIEYYNYLTTNKVPITLHIPIGKYFDGENGSTYLAGRLKFAVYFVDRQNQLSTNQTPYKLFEINEFLSNDIAYWGDNGTYIINFQGLIQGGSVDINPEFRNLLNSTNKNWIYLPGDYVIVLTDMVKTTGTENQTVYGFRVSHEDPTIEVYSQTKKGVVDKIVDEASQGFVLQTNQEFVKFEIPEYVKVEGDSKTYTAQIDPEFLYITKNGSPYISYNYALINGIYQPQLNDTQVITLDTGITRSGNDLVGFEKYMTYQITVRYKVADNDNNDSDFAEYANCYKYLKREINGYSIINSFESTYTIIIDREAPMSNINNFYNGNSDLGVLADTLISSYNAKNNVTDTFTDKTTDQDYLFFDKVYNQYYQNKNSQYVYAFRVTNKTYLQIEGSGYQVYFNPLDDADGINLTAPTRNMAGYQTASLQYAIDNKILYSSFLTEVGKYYEIVERDAAGNSIQYVVYYAAETEDVDLTFACKLEYDKDIYTNVAITSQSKLIFFDVNNIEITGSDKFYILEIQKSGSTKDVVYADFTKTAQQIKQEILQAFEKGPGHYDVTLHTRLKTASISIDYYANDLKLDTSDLVNNDRTTIKLYGANFQDAYGSWRYAKKITVISITDEGVTDEKTYKISNDNEYANYYIEGNSETKLYSEIPTQPNTTYKLVVIDGADNPYSPYIFRGHDRDYKYHQISFEDDLYYSMGGQYFALADATITYNTTMFDGFVVKYTINDGSQNQITSEDVNNEIVYEYCFIIVVDKVNGTILLRPYFYSGIGAKIVFTITLNPVDGGQNVVYNLIMDSRTATTILKDSATGQINPMNIMLNESYLDTEYKTTVSGSKVLSWSEYDNNYFGYNYLLHVQTKTNNDIGYVTIACNNVSAVEIPTQTPNKTGVYKFEVAVYCKLDATQKQIGNVVYTFFVEPKSTKYYSVHKQGNQVIDKANAMFTFEDVKTYIFNKYKVENDNDIAEGVLTFNVADMPVGNFPLYISNEDLIVVTASDQGFTHYKYVYNGFVNNEVLTIHELKSDTFPLYFAVLNVPNRDTLITEMIIGEDIVWGSGDKLPEDNFYTWCKNGEFAVELKSSAENDNILKKNTLNLEYYYDRVKIASQAFDRGIDVKQFGGYGAYHIKVTDLAGNIHSFVTQYSAIGFEYMEVTILKKVAIRINEQAPIDNAYYNNNVSFRIDNPTIYDLGTLSWIATRNGIPYVGSQSQFSYNFTQSGTYKIVVTATCNGLLLKNIIVFTIVNEKEARAEFDLTNLSGYQITKVLNDDGIDITQAFKDEFTASPKGMLLNYSSLFTNEDLKLNSGKQTFTVTYVVKDRYYPQREVTFSFTMNNEKPTIDCSLKPGETSTKKFDITFNAGIIYDQIGEAGIYVNDELVFAINETSINEMTTLVFTEKLQGAGNYYVSLKTSSGDIVLTFKAELKEPLNTGAIIIIVVVSAIALAVAVTIIVLRHKMKIR